MIRLAMTRRNALLAGAVALATAAGVTTGILIWRDDDGLWQRDPAGAVGASAVDGVPGGEAEGTPPPGSVVVPVYYLGPSVGNATPRLYREFHRMPGGGNPVTTALTAIFTQEAKDSDYRSAWAERTGVRSVRRSGDTLTVDLNAAAATGTRGPLEVASVRQLVYTATAADTTARRVRVLINGQARPTLWGGVSLRAPLARGDSRTELGGVWILDPVEGRRVPRTFTVKGESTTFEGALVWELRDANANEVKRGTAQGGATSREAFSFQVTAPGPGVYQLIVYEESAKDGAPSQPDSKTVQVR